MTPNPGSRLSGKSKTVLGCLQKNGAKNRLDLEMVFGFGNLQKPIQNLLAAGYIKRQVPDVGPYTITNLGRQALGEALEIKAPSEIRICGGTTFDPYDPVIHLTARVGIARA